MKLSAIHFQVLWIISVKRFVDIDGQLNCTVLKLHEFVLPDNFTVAVVSNSNLYLSSFWTIIYD